MNKFKLIIVFLMLLFFSLPLLAQAEYDLALAPIFANREKEVIVCYKNEFSVQIPVNAFSGPASVRMEKIGTSYHFDEAMNSPVYQFDFNSPEISTLIPLEIKIKYQTEDLYKKVIKYWDNNKQAWIELPSRNDVYKKEVVAQTHLVFARVAVFTDKNFWEGEASWYAYKDCDCAASRDYPKGTLLKVTNIYNGVNYGKSVIIKVNDYGPELWTGRVIDLDKTAYEKIGFLGGGVMPVSVELVK